MSEVPPDREHLQKDLRAYERLAEIASALANPLRLELLELLAQAPRRVDDLARSCGLPVKTTSHHLLSLRSAGLVTRAARGREAVYSLADEGVATLWTHLEDYAHSRVRAAEEQVGFETPAVGAALAGLGQDGHVALIDVRPREEYAAGHLPAALSVPLGELPRRLDELPRDKLVVAVCRGRYCRLADAAVRILQQHGFDAVRYAGGMLEYRGVGRVFALSSRDEGVDG